MKREAYPSRAQINVHRTELEGYAATEVYQSNEGAGVARDTLDDMVREGAWRLLAAALSER